MSLKSKKIGSDKQPYRILLKDQLIFSMAGLWETWTSPEGEEVKSCAIITTEPNELMVDINQDLLMKKHNLLISSTLCTCVFSKYG
jgi:putative SOS response-associated peptidase YedK